MRLKKTLSCALAGAVVALTTPNAFAGEGPAPEEVLAACTSHLRVVVDETAGSIAQVTGNTVERLEELGENGASNPRLVVAAGIGAARITEIAGTAHGLIDQGVHRCLHVLEAIEAPAPVTRAAVYAGGVAQHAVTSAASRGRWVIRHALREAIGETSTSAF